MVHRGLGHTEVRALTPRKHGVLLPSHEQYLNPHKPIIHHSIRIHGRRKKAIPPITRKTTLQNLHVSTRYTFDSFPLIRFLLSAESCFTAPRICPFLTKTAQWLDGARFGHDDLPDLNMPGAKGPGVGQEIIFPHPFENPVIFF